MCKEQNHLGGRNPEIQGNAEPLQPGINLHLLECPDIPLCETLKFENPPGKKIRHLQNSSLAKSAFASQHLQFSLADFQFRDFSWGEITLMVSQGMCLGYLE